MQFPGCVMKHRLTSLSPKTGEADLVVMSYEAFQKMVARQRLGQMLTEADREIAGGKELRDFEAIFAALKKRVEDA